MVVYRIERQKYLETTLQGLGAAKSEGFRWNSLHTNMVYTSESRALAILEVTAHLDLMEHLPTDRVYVEIFIPDSITVLELDEDMLPDQWDSKPPIKNTQLIGDEFVLQNDAAILKVPSCIIPQEFNYLINPFHKDAKKIKVINANSVVFDDRLFGK